MQEIDYIILEGLRKRKKNSKLSRDNVRDLLPLLRLKIQEKNGIT